MSPGEVVRERGSVVVEEKGVIGEGTHSNANLTRTCEAIIEVSNVLGSSLADQE